MRSRTIYLAILIMVTAPAPVLALNPSDACTREPHASTRTKSPQLMAARRAEHQACAADLATYCADVPKGCGRPKQCLKEHEAQLSAACKSAWQNLRALRAGHS